MIDVTCTHMVVTPGPHGTRHLVIFDPTEDTVKSILQWHMEESTRKVRVFDRSGTHVAQFEVYATKVTQDYGTMIVTTSPKVTT